MRTWRVESPTTAADSARTTASPSLPSPSPLPSTSANNATTTPPPLSSPCTFALISSCNPKSDANTNQIRRFVFASCVCPYFTLAWSRQERRFCTDQYSTQAVGFLLDAPLLPRPPPPAPAAAAAAGSSRTTVSTLDTLLLDIALPPTSAALPVPPPISRLIKPSFRHVARPIHLWRSCRAEPWVQVAPV